MLEWPGNSPYLNPIENVCFIKDNVAYKQSSSAENLRYANQGCLGHCEYLVFSMPCHIQAVTDSKEGHTKYWKLETLTLLDVIKFQNVLCYAFVAINIYNLV